MACCHFITCIPPTLPLRFVVDIMIILELCLGNYSTFQASKTCPSTTILNPILNHFESFIKALSCLPAVEVMSAYSKVDTPTLICPPTWICSVLKMVCHVHTTALQFGWKRVYLDAPMKLLQKRFNKH